MLLFITKSPHYVFLFSLLVFTINAQWPTADVPPPIRDEWTNLVDMSKVPDAPVSKAPGDCGTNDFCNWSCNNCVRTETDIIQCPNKYDWGLTFDDGPTAFTDTLLDYLSSINVTVTFFVVGSRVPANPQILKKAISAGHQIGVHTWSHPYLTTQSNEEIIAEIKWTELIIKTVTGVTPKYMRPPYGDVDDRVRGIVSQLGYKVVIWDKDTTDYISAVDKTFQLDWIEGNFTEWVKEDDPTGHISLEHDLYQQTAAQAPKVIPIVQGAGFTIKPIALCVGDPNPYVESTNSPIAPVTTAPAIITVTPSVVTPAQTPIDGTREQNTDSDKTPEPQPTPSNAISHTKNNYYLLSLVLFIASFYII